MARQAKKPVAFIIKAFWAIIGVYTASIVAPTIGNLVGSYIKPVGDIVSGLGTVAIVLRNSMLDPLFSSSLDATRANLSANSVLIATNYAKQIGPEVIESIPGLIKLLVPVGTAAVTIREGNRKNWNISSMVSSLGGSIWNIFQPKNLPNVALIISVTALAGMFIEDWESIVEDTSFHIAGGIVLFLLTMVALWPRLENAMKNAAVIVCAVFGVAAVVIIVSPNIADKILAIKPELISSIGFLGNVGRGLSDQVRAVVMLVTLGILSGFVRSVTTSKTTSKSGTQQRSA